MSTLGKIVTIFIVVASVANGALVVGYAKLSTDWRGEALRADEALQKAVQTMAVLKAAIQDNNAHLEKMRLTFLTKSGDDRKTIDGLRDNVSALTREKEQQETRLEKISADITNLQNDFARVNQEKERLESQLDEAQKTAVQIREANQNVVKKNLTLTRDVEDLRDRVRQFQLQVADLTKQLNWYKENWEGGAVPKEIPVLPSVDLRGVIRSADNERKVAEISLGSRDKVVEGMRFIVSRGDQFVADLIITRVDENAAVGRLETVQAQVQEGDNVAYTVKR